MRKGRKIVFVLGLVGRVSVCMHYCSEIKYFPALTMAARAEKKILSKRFAHAMLTPSACTVEIWSTLTYTEFDCVALLAI